MFPKSGNTANFLGLPLSIDDYQSTYLIISKVLKPLKPKILLHEFSDRRGEKGAILRPNPAVGCTIVRMT